MIYLPENTPNDQAPKVEIKTEKLVAPDQAVATSERAQLQELIQRYQKDCGGQFAAFSLDLYPEAALLDYSVNRVHLEESIEKLLKIKLYNKVHIVYIPKP